jgi:formylglycine-generating enzyme required for sulfatase activity
MSGNVWEWCNDWYGSYSSSSQTNPKGASSGSYRVLRGGDWFPDAGSVRVSDRRDFPDFRDSGIGFRLASSTDTVAGVPFEMVFVEGGTFWMGAQSADPNAPNYDTKADDDESPVHQVTLSDYCIGKYPVTQAQWKAVMGSNPSYSKGDNLPVETVSWNDVQDFICELNRQTGKNYRLPTEAEWEFAARGGNSSRGYKYSGSNDVGSVAWYDENSGNKTHLVGTKQASELGIYDMSGNVWEWCNDWYGSYSRNSQTNPKGASSGSYRVFRGGSWSNYARYVRVSYRYGIYPVFRYYYLGFRLASSSK